MKTLLTIIAFCLASSTYAAVGERVTVRGKVLSLDANMVTLKSQSGPIKVPRQYFSESTKGELRPDKEASAEIPLVTLVETNSPTKEKR